MCFVRKSEVKKWFNSRIENSGNKHHSPLVQFLYGIGQTLFSKSTPNLGQRGVVMLYDPNKVTLIPVEQRIYVSEIEETIAGSWY